MICSPKAIAAILTILSAQANAQTSLPCIITEYNVDKIYKGAVLESVENALGCKLRKVVVRRNGFEDYSSSSTYEVIDDRGSIFRAFMNEHGRIRDYDLRLR